ncbi:MAG: hypothetical protein P8Y44_06865 [Acidobacteriota bacterium]
MKRVRDEDLILHYYGESPDAEALERTIRQEPEVARRYEDLCRVLDSVAEIEVPATGSDYGAKVWRTLSPKLDRASWWRRWLQPGSVNRWALAGATAGLIVIAFIAGRLSTPTPQIAPQDVATWTTYRDRALLTELARHLDRSEMLLLELDNSDTGSGADLARERALASELSSDSRFYSQAASKAGQRDVADLLERVEFLFAELANGPEAVAPGDLDSFRERLETGDLLFRLRIVSSRLRLDLKKINRYETPGSTVLDT